MKYLILLLSLSLMPIYFSPSFGVVEGQVLGETEMLKNKKRCERKCKGLHADRKSCRADCNNRRKSKHRRSCKKRCDADEDFGTAKVEMCFKSCEPDCGPRCFWSEAGQLCACAIEGRPFFDTTGKMIASIIIPQYPQATTSVDESSLPTNGIDDDDNRGATLQLVQDWKARAVGEHASIASFAANTVALMTNGAPPDLVKASLMAALDEWHHAEQSLESVEKLLRSNPSSSSSSSVQLSALPPSKLSFETDLSTLAVSTAREGCIAETLSAIQMTAEVDAYHIKVASMAAGSSCPPSNEGATLQSELMDKTAKIALEEGQHSVLAWRTIAWVCKKDERACKDVVSRALAPDLLSSAFEDRFGRNSTDPHQQQAITIQINEAWRGLHEVLVPFVTAGTTTTATMNHCDNSAIAARDNNNDNWSLTDKIVSNILTGVVCNDNETKNNEAKKVEDLSCLLVESKE